MNGEAYAHAKAARWTEMSSAERIAEIERVGLVRDTIRGRCERRMTLIVIGREPRAVRDPEDVILEEQAAGDRSEFP